MKIGQKRVQGTKRGSCCKVKQRHDRQKRGAVTGGKTTVTQLSQGLKGYYVISEVVYMRHLSIISILATRDISRACPFKGKRVRKLGCIWLEMDPSAPHLLVNFR